MSVNNPARHGPASVARPGNQSLPLISLANNLDSLCREDFPGCDCQPIGKKAIAFAGEWSNLMTRHGVHAQRVRTPG
jgi:hypothetical protein